MEGLNKRVRCPVIETGVPPAALEVNAFRVVQEVGNSFFLDFIHFSPASQQGEVVTRLRVHEDALESFRERLADDMVEIRGVEITVVMPERRTVH